MEKEHSCWKKGLAFSVVATCLCFGASAGAQSTSSSSQVQTSQDNRSDQAQTTQDNRADRDNATVRQERANFDQFLDSHREIADQVRRDPSLLNNPEFVKNHPALQTYLQDHPAISAEIKDNPNAFMRQEDRFDRPGDNRDRDATHRELANFDQFLDSHREIAEQIRKDPSLVDNRDFVRDHPALQTYLQDHPEVRAEIRENPNSFMQEEARYDQHDDYRDRDNGHQGMARFDQFLDSHREIAEQIRRDPSLANNPEFVKDHPVLQAYLQNNPDVRADINANPSAFRDQEAQYDHTGNGVGRDRRPADFGAFLSGHSDVAQQLSKNPDLVKDHDYLDNRPDLRAYLDAHPDVRQALLDNPHDFFQSAQQFSNSNGQTMTTPGSPMSTAPKTMTPTTTTPSTTAKPAPAPAPQPKQ